MFRKTTHIKSGATADFKLEYGTATIEVHKDSIDKGDSVLITDDLIATGGSMMLQLNLLKCRMLKLQLLFL